MSIEETRALWEKFKAADQAHDAEATAELYADDVVFVGTPLKGRAALRRFDGSFFAAFPDYQREFLTEVVAEDTIVFVHRYTATHSGDWLGLKATGVRLDVTGCSVMTVRDGHFSEVQIFQPDVMGQLRREANIQLAQRYYAAERARDFDSCAACFAPGLEVWANGRFARSGREAHVQHMRETFAAFPDWRVEMLSLLADGDTVVCRWQASATHSGPYGAIPATGKRIELFGTTSFEVNDGFIQFYRVDLDTSPFNQLAGG